MPVFHGLSRRYEELSIIHFEPPSKRKTGELEKLGHRDPPAVKIKVMSTRRKDELRQASWCIRVPAQTFVAGGAAVGGAQGAAARREDLPKPLWCVPGVTAAGLGNEARLSN